MSSRPPTARRARLLLWAPSFLAGAALAAALGTGAHILLYDAAGLMRAGGALLGASAAALFAGLWTGRASAANGLPASSAARGWTAFLAALAAGAAFSGLWELRHAFGAARLAQGTGLALTSALPAYFAGGVWRRLHDLAAPLGAGPRRQVLLGGALGGVGGGAAAAAAIGGSVLAATAFVAAAVLASAGARLHGWVIDRVPALRMVATRAARPDLRFESWRADAGRAGVNVLWERGADRLVDPPPAGDWRAAAASALDASRPVLFLGAGSWFAPGDDREWRVFEPDRELGRLAAEGCGWDSAALADSPLPPAPGWTVVAERKLLAGVTMDDLRAAGVAALWIGGRRGLFPDALRDEGAAAGFELTRYAGSFAGAEGPPRLEARREELWRFALPGEPPAPVAGMKEIGPAEISPAETGPA